MTILFTQLSLTVVLFFSVLPSYILADAPTHGESEISSVPGHATTISATYAATPPRLDGVLDFGEWPLADALQFDGGLLAVRNDAHRLYILLDLLEDTAADAPLPSSPWGDRLWLTVDVNGDGAITRDMDVRYALQPGTVNLRQQTYLGPGTWTPLSQELPRSSMATGFDCFFADESRAVTVVPGFPFPVLTCSAHRIWELGIDLAEIGAAAGETVRLGVSLSSQNPSFTTDLPDNLHYDFSDLVEVALADALSNDLPADPDATVRFQPVPFATSIEVTQVIQDFTNSLPLVAAKPTAVRLYMVANNAQTPQPVRVYLYGAQAGQDLPGSPLVMSFFAPTNLDRTRLSETANFLLPESWLEGNVELQARLVDALGTERWATLLALTFQPTDTPTYWVIPINTNTAAEPVVMDNAEITRQESYLQSTLPVPEVHFVRKRWQEIGAIPSENLADNIDVLKGYDRTTQLAWYSSVEETGEAPFVLPDAIYGIRPGAGGLSDPIWNGGGGRVAVGGERASSQEGTMTHEIIHILDKTSSGSWGRHAPGCNASGADPFWPYANEQIQDIGFDTRLPWSDSTTVVTESWADLMSYCFSLSPPTKWISSYRWIQLFNMFSSAGSTTSTGSTTKVSAAKLRQAEMQSVYYVSGILNIDGTGHLEPIWVQPGIPTSNIAPGDYAIQVRDASGSSLQTTPFLASFVGVEGEEVETVRFSFQLNEMTAATQFLLQHDEQILDSISVSAHPPTVTVVTPNGGESWDGLQTIEWQAEDVDGDSLLFSVFYSPNNGRSWLPIGGNLAGTSHTVDTGVLPGGERARIRVLVTDGFNTTSDRSDATFSLARKPPQVAIQTPATSAHHGSGELISFVGQAADLEDRTIPEDSFIWSYGTQNFASGRQVSAILPDGDHDVTLTVIDSDGNRGRDSITVSVGNYLRYLPFVRYP
ncbi:MAG: hypothetical protein AAF702_16060 [Chloroflexota bacterium]